MTDTVAVFPWIHLPFAYASHDPFGRKDWAGSQVLSLLDSPQPQGNCFALAGFFKILSDRLQSGAAICTAPQHIYIQHRDKKGQLYNVELATAGHPGDGIIQTLTYTTTEAVMSGIALREYTDLQSIGLCVVNLAKGYEHRFDTRHDGFLLRCAGLALRHDSLCLNALLLQQQVLDERVTRYALENGITGIARLKAGSDIAGDFLALQDLLKRLHRLGYRPMPPDMQRQILEGFSGEQTGVMAITPPSPYTSITPPDPDDGQYVTLSHGAFREVFVPQRYEAYGHFTLDTQTGTISSFDPAAGYGVLIDPVAFAYDFGARMYDARTGTFISVDPMAQKFAGWSPYTGLADNPIMFIDPDGREIVGVTKEDAHKVQQDLNTIFSGDQFEKFRGLFTLDKKGTTFNSISTEAIAGAFEGITLSADQQTLVNEVTGVINSEFVHKVEFVSIDGSVSEEGTSAFKTHLNNTQAGAGDAMIPSTNMPGVTMNAVSGGGINIPTKKGSHSVIMEGKGVTHDGGRALTTGHEIVGHGPASANKVTPLENNTRAIRVDNLIRRVMGITTYRTEHGGAEIVNPYALP